MPIKNVTMSDRNGVGRLALGNSTLLEAIWLSVWSNAAAFERKRFVESAGIWAHQAILYADPANANDITFGPSNCADCRVLAAGTEYLIPPVYPYVGGTWTAFDLGDWYFRSTSVCRMNILYV